MVEITSHGVVSVETKVTNILTPATVGCRPYQRVELLIQDSDGIVMTISLYTRDGCNMAFSHTERTQ